MSLNEKLAEVCGLEKTDDGFFLPDNKHCYPDYLRDDNWKESPYLDIDIWQPTQDLNQLRECYLAAEKEVGEEFHARFYIELTFALVEKGFNTAKDLTAAWVKHPELVAQAILKAKGVDA